MKTVLQILGVFTVAAVALVYGYISGWNRAAQSHGIWLGTAAEALSGYEQDDHTNGVGWIFWNRIYGVHQLPGDGAQWIWAPPEMFREKPWSPRLGETVRTRLAPDGTMGRWMTNRVVGGAWSDVFHSGYKILVMVH